MIPIQKSTNKSRVRNHRIRDPPLHRASISTGSTVFQALWSCFSVSTGGSELDGLTPAVSGGENRHKIPTGDQTDQTVGFIDVY